MWMDMFLVDDEIKQVGFNPQGSNIKKFLLMYPYDTIFSIYKMILFQIKNHLFGDKRILLPDKWCLFVERGDKRQYDTSGK